MSRDLDERECTDEPELSRRSLLRGAGGATAGVVGMAACAGPAAGGIQEDSTLVDPPASTITFHSLDGSQLRATVTVNVPASSFARDPEKVLELMDALELPQGTRAFSVAAADSIVR